MNKLYEIHYSLFHYRIELSLFTFYLLQTIYINSLRIHIQWVVLLKIKLRLQL